MSTPMAGSVVDIRRFLGFVLRRFTLARWALLLTFLLLLLEYAGISVMIPLASASGSHAGGQAAVVRLWTAVANSIGLAPTIMTWVWLFLVLLALRSAAGYVHVLVTSALAKQVHRRLSEEVFQRVLVDEPMVQVYKRSIGYYVSLAGDDTFRAGSLVQSALLMLAGACSALAGLVLLYLFSGLAFWTTIGFLSLSAMLVAYGISRMLRLNGRAVQSSREASTSFLEALNSLRSIRSMASEPYVYSTYHEQMRRYTRLLFSVEAYKAGIRMVPGLVALVTGVIALGPWWHGSAPFAPEAIFAGTTIIIRVFLSLGAMMTYGGTFLVDARAAKDLGELTGGHGNPSGRPQHEGSAPAHAEFGLLELDSVGFSYDPAAPVLRNISYRFHPGTTVAIIGPSGSGKSTLADVLLGMVEPEAGSVRINGRAVRADSLRRRVVLVEQQPRIFSVSVRENVTLGIEATDQEIWVALGAVGMQDVVESLPQGLDTLLDYQGSNLSGGQRQRLSIARALLRKPHVLILDEATSALDAETRDTVVVRIRRHLADGVVVFITHDEAIARLADSVLVLEPAPR